MKKVVSRVLMLTLVSVMLFGMVGCNNETTPPVEEKPVVDTQTPDTPDVPETPDESETPDEPVVEEPAEVVVGMMDIVETMRNTYGDYFLPSMELDAESFNMMLGIDSTVASEYYDEFYGAVPMMGTHVDKLFIAKTSDVSKMEDTFRAYMDAQINDAMQYPMNISKLENYKVVTMGDYVILFILGGYTDSMPVDDGTKTPEQLEAEQEEINVTYYNEMNEKGVAALIALFETGEIPAPTSDVVDETVDIEITEGEETDDAEGETEGETEDAETTEDTTTEGESEDTSEEA